MVLVELPAAQPTTMPEANPTSAKHVAMTFAEMAEHSFALLPAMRSVASQILNDSGALPQ